VAALAAAAFVTFPSLSPRVEAGTPVPGAKSDRLDTRPLGPSCSQKAWPYFEAGCLRDTRRTMGQAREVRLISTDSITAGTLRTTR
jgi:hypothetical protein